MNLDNHKREKVLLEIGELFQKNHLTYLEAKGLLDEAKVNVEKHMESRVFVMNPGSPEK